MSHDRVGEDEFQLTQEFLAQMLYVRRPTVTAVAGTLQKAGLISYHRGSRIVLDRKAEAALGMLRSGCEGVGPLARLTPGACRPAFEPQDERQSLPGWGSIHAPQEVLPQRPRPCGSGKTYESCCYVKAVEWVEDEEDGTVQVHADVAGTSRRPWSDGQAFVARHGREPGPDDLLFPDPPHPEHLEAILSRTWRGRRFHLPFPNAGILSPKRTST